MDVFSDFTVYAGPVMLNYESIPVINLTIMFTVDDGIDHVTSYLFVNIIDINESPEFLTSQYNVTVEEGNVSLV